LLLFAPLVAVGCAKSETVHASDVITVVACPDAGGGGACQKFADGASLITVEACIPDSVMPLASGLTATLLASAGTWQNAPDKTQPGTFTASLSGNRCTRPTLIAPTNVLSVRVDAQLAGYTSSTTIDLAPAILRTVELTAQPPFISADTDQILIRAVVRADGLGAPTAGTFVAFDVTPLPGTVYAAAFPSTSVIDSSSSAQTTVIVAPNLKSVTVTATATGPSTPGSDASSKMNTITISAPSADGGARDGS
jgi:hypothetical protein